MNANETVTRCIQRLFGYVRRTAASPRTVDSPRMTLYSSSVPEGDITHLANLSASTYIRRIPALQIIRTIIPLCGFGHTEEWKWLPTSERRITRDGDPMHTPTLARIIVECAVLGAAVVPDRQRTNAGVTAVFGRTFLVVPAEYLAVSDITGLDALEHFFHGIG